MYKIELEQFAGPLDVLLQLIEKEELDITTISLSQVADDYLNWLDSQPDIPPHDLADFLVVASRLLLIKSAVLLPGADTGEEMDPELLAKQLRLLKKFVDLGKGLQKQIDSSVFLYGHPFKPVFEAGFYPADNLDLSELRQSFERVLDRLSVEEKEAAETIKRVISIEERITDLKEHIAVAAQSRLSHVLSEANDKHEVIVTFLALLELVKQRHIKLTQSGGHFSDIEISKV